MTGPRRTFRGRSGSGRSVQWVGPADQGFVAVPAGGVTLLGSITFDEPVTVVRVRGAVSVAPSDPSASAIIRGAIGIGVVTAEAFAAGSGSIPRPFENADWGGWLAWRSFGYIWDVTTDIDRHITSIQFELDSKAMRKVPNSGVVVIVADSQGGGAFQIFNGFRVLVKLS